MVNYDDLIYTHEEFLHNFLHTTRHKTNTNYGNLVFD